MDDYESDNSSDESDTDSDSDSDDNSSEIIHNKTLISNEVEKNDTLSLCSVDSDYDIEKEIDIEFY